MSIQDDINAKIKDALYGVGTDGRAELKRTCPRASGNLKDNIDFNLKSSGSKVELSFTMPEYAKYVEYGIPPRGEGPFKRPTLTKEFVQAIEEWCRAKGIELEAAYPIARMLSKQGTRPQPFVRPLFNNKLEKIIQKNLITAFK